MPVIFWMILASVIVLIIVLFVVSRIVHWRSIAGSIVLLSSSMIIIKSLIMVFWLTNSWSHLLSRLLRLLLIRLLHVLLRSTHRWFLEILIPAWWTYRSRVCMSHWRSWTRWHSTNTTHHPWIRLHEWNSSHFFFPLKFF